MASDPFQISGRIVDIEHDRIYAGVVTVANKRIESIKEIPDSTSYPFLMPGFIDAHVHIESSMLVPSEFARLAVPHGTVSTVSDPHEIANVCGLIGVQFMIRNGGEVPFKFNFGAPSCVPATQFETAGAALGPAEVAELLRRPEVKYLAEMMNFPGVIHRDENVHAKLALARQFQKPIDGHAPGLRGEDARTYFGSGISTDHECFTYEEAEEKLRLGVSILIREGSAAKNFEALIELLRTYPEKIMFCSDDKHPNDLVRGHINELVVRALQKKIPLMSVLRAASRNPVKHYSLSVGLLQKGDPADFIVVENIETMKVAATYIDGTLVAKDGRALFHTSSYTPLNSFACTEIAESDIFVKAVGSAVRVIDVFPGQLVTGESVHKVRAQNGAIVSDVKNDILKLVVLNRYFPAPPAIGFVRNFGLKEGALASTVAHDSHNIIAVGVNDADIVTAVNCLIEAEGGIAAVSGKEVSVLPLPVGGLMSHLDGYDVAKRYEELDALAKKFGSMLPSPFMTLSFLALLVIPSLKLSDKGLFDGTTFQFVDLFL